MKVKNSKFSGDYGTQSLNNRLTRLEKLIEHVLQPNIDGNRDKNNLTISAGINDLVKSKNNVFGKINVNGLQQASDFTIKPTDNQPQVPKRNNLSLSYGQMIAELASVITRFGRRNS